MRHIGLSLIYVSALVLGGCSEAPLTDSDEATTIDIADTSGDTATDTDTEAEAELTLPTPSEEPEVVERPNGWLEIRPGGETACSRGTDYAYFVRPGDPENNRLSAMIFSYWVAPWYTNRTIRVWQYQII